MRKKAKFWQKVLLVWLISMLLTILGGALFPNTILFGLFASISIISLTVLILCIPIYIVLYFDRKFIKEEIRSRRPLGITIIAALNLFTIINLFNLGKAYKMPFFGLIAPVWLFKIWMILTTLLCIYIGIGFIKLIKTSWYVFVVSQVFYLLISVANLLLLDEEKILMIFEHMPKLEHAAMIFKSGTVFGVITGLIFLVYVFSRKHVFIPVSKVKK